jgi:hypothetical protein
MRLHLKIVLQCIKIGLEMNNMVTVSKQNTTKCTKCSNELTYEDKDIIIVPRGSWQDFYIKCPICSNDIKVCYVNGL